MKTTIALTLLALSPVVGVCDFVNASTDVAEYRVYDESIQLITYEGHRTVLYYVRVEEKPKVDMAGNRTTSVSSYQGWFNCETKYWSIRNNENESFSTISWTLPDSLGRVGGEYACNKAYPKK